jgi:nicotinamide phosphoribosyltransferase
MKNLNNLESILLTDGYKLGHRVQYPEGTEYVYSNWTPRSNAYYPEAKDGVVVFGIQYFIKEYLIKRFNDDFFNKPINEVIDTYKRRVSYFTGVSPDTIDTTHIEDLHKLGYLPIRIKALPEGTMCPIKIPAMTLVNTNPKFFWLTNYFETLISATLWMPMTSATTSRLAKKLLVQHAKKTGFYNDPNIELGFLCHDFSMRGMAGLESAIISGMGHLTSFIGSETIPAVRALEEYYNADVEKELVSATVPATEHSVMCAGGCDDEFETFKRLITETYPEGFISIVSDTWDYWKVITEYLPRLKNEIMARNGRVVIRPDSGDPVQIICGMTKSEIIGNSENYQEQSRIPEYAIDGTYEVLWNIFGGTINKQGYRVLDPHIGLIYGDSINLGRQKEIYRRLEAKGFAATNLVLGYGSFSFQFKSRDSLGFAMKATWCKINGKQKEIFKCPKTDNGTKKSLKGLIEVIQDSNGYMFAKDQVSLDEEKQGLLQTVFEDGKLVKEFTLAEIRKNVNASI